MPECYGKNKYACKKDAETAKNYARNQRGVKLRIYVCPQCNKWHLSKHEHNGGKL